MGYIPHEVGSEPYRRRRSHGLILAKGGEKMSKSKGNVVNPDDVVNEYGADVFRVYEMFMGPFDQAVPWDTNGIEGVRRFLDKVWNAFESVPGTDQASSELETLYHQTIKKITDGIENLQFNTCISQLMILTNAFQEAGLVPGTMREGYLKILAPFAPHLAEELWEKMGGKGSIHVSAWPTPDASKLQSATFELVVQVNGKLRDRVRVASDISEEEARKLALSAEKVQAFIVGQEPKQVVYVPGRLVNIVL
jgi:leucyl-tRNA synthetase